MSNPGSAYSKHIVDTGRKLYNYFNYKKSRKFKFEWHMLFHAYLLVVRTGKYITQNIHLKVNCLRCIHNINMHYIEYRVRYPCLHLHRLLMKSQKKLKHILKTYKLFIMIKKNLPIFSSLSQLNWSLLYI